MRKKAWQLSNGPRRKPPKQVEQAASDGRFFVVVGLWSWVFGLRSEQPSS
jgi:hypothetical protein